MYICNRACNSFVSKLNMHYPFFTFMWIAITLRNGTMVFNELTFHFLCEKENKGVCSAHMYKCLKSEPLEPEMELEAEPEFQVEAEPELELELEPELELELEPELEVDPNL